MIIVMEHLPRARRRAQHSLCSPQGNVMRWALLLAPFTSVGTESLRVCPLPQLAQLVSDRSRMVPPGMSDSRTHATASREPECIPVCPGY